MRLNTMVVKLILKKKVVEIDIEKKIYITLENEFIRQFSLAVNHISLHIFGIEIFLKIK